MRRGAVLLAAAAATLAACSRSSPPDRASADSATRDSIRRDSLRSADSAMLGSRPDPVITDSAAIFLARGTRPFWSVEIMDEGIRYRWEGNRTGVVFPAGRVDGNDTNSVWSAKRSAGAPQSLQMQILRMSCTLPGTDSTFAFRVAMVVDNERFQGCAKAGPNAPWNNPNRRR